MRSIFVMIFKRLLRLEKRRWKAHTGTDHAEPPASPQRAIGFLPKIMKIFHVAVSDLLGFEDKRK